MKFEIIEQIDEYILAVREKPSYLPFYKGWGNGYVSLPKSHSYYGKHYDDIPVYDVHGFLTYSDFDEQGNYWVGFDTMHLYDTIEEWSKEKVIEETYKLFNQLKDIA